MEGILYKKLILMTKSKLEGPKNKLEESQVWYLKLEGASII